MKRLTLFLLAFNFIFAIQAQVIVPAQTDEIIIDNGASGKADPNDRIRYKVTIQNTGGTNGNGTQLNIVPDPRTSFVPGSFRSSPLAVPDGPYACTGNVGINIPAVSGLKANDFDDNIAGATVSAGTFATTQGGSIIITADGGFTYTPPAGFTGSDSYSYTLNDGNPVGLPVPLTDMATVTFTVSNMIWFISNVGGGSGGTGTRLNPFKTLADFNVASGTAAGHVVHLQFTGTDYPGGIVLKNNMLLFGTGHTGGLTLADVLPFALATNSPTLPAINGTRPVVENSGGDGIFLASGNTIRGLNIGNCSDFGIDDNGNVGTLTISELNISTTGGGFRTDNGGTLTVTLGSLASTGGTNGLHLGSTSGTFSVSGSASVTNSSGIGINISSTSGGSVTFNTLTVGGSGSHCIELAGNAATFTVTGNTTINSPAAGANLSLHISTGSGAITFAGIDINGRRDKGIRIAGGTRNITTGALDIDNSNAITASAMEINAPTGGTISFGATTINNNGANGSAIEIQNNTASVSFASGSSITNCAGTDFFCNLGTGNVTFDGSINSTGGGSVTVQSRTSGTVSFQGNITHNAAATAININNNTGGTINFSGSSKSLSSGTSNAVNLTTNTGATINFTSGGLVINTTSGAGFNATGGGTVTVQGTGNTITSPSGTALNVVSTTIGSSNLTFQSISSGNNTAAADPVNGIVLNNTGSSGGLTVTGTSTTSGSGGTIQFTSNDGISINSAVNISLKNMNIQDIGNMAGGHNTNSGHDGIQVSALTGLILDNMIIRRISDNAILGAVGASTSTIITGLQIINCNIEDSNRFHVANTGDANNEGTIRILGIIGTVIISNSNFQRGAEFLDFVTHTSGTLNMTVTNCNFLYAYKEFTSGVLASVGLQAIDVISEGSAIANITIGDLSSSALGNTFLNCRVGSVRLGNNPGATGNMTFIVSNNDFTVDDHTSGIGGDFDFPMGGLLLFSLGTNTANINAIVSNNYFDEVTNANGGVGQLTLSMQGGTWQTLVENNTFDTPGNAPFFIRADTGNSTVLFRNNTYIRGGFCSTDPAAAGPGCGGCGDAGAGAGYCGPGLRSLVQAQNGGHINISFINEDFAKHDSGFDPGNTVEVQVTTAGSSACANFSNNSSPEGYSVEQFAGTLNVQRGVSDTSCSGCSAAQLIDVFGDNGNTGGSNNPLLTPPAVTVLGTVNTTNTACPVPSGGIFN